MKNILQNQTKVKTSAFVSGLMGNSRNMGHVAPIAWGNTHEIDGNKAFVVREAGNHSALSVRTAVLYVCRGNPYLAATPDGIVSCPDAVLEVKCPYKIRDMAVSDGWDETDFLKKDLQHGNIVLLPEHNYYCQVQGQMAIANCKRAYFVVWTLKGDFDHHYCV